MSHVDVNEIRPMRDDIVLLHHSINEHRKIYIAEDVDQDKALMFEVMRVGRDAVHVGIGDIVMVPWTRCVPPFEVLIDGVVKKVTITSEKELLGVMENVV